MNDLQIFNHPDFGEVRTVTINDEPWFVGKDVARVLGYKNPQEAIRTHVDDEDKGVSEILTPGGKQSTPIPKWKKKIWKSSAWFAEIPGAVKC